jgi:hypothetical protein
MRRFSALLASVVLILAALGTSVAYAGPSGPNTETLQLQCENGQSFEIVAPVDSSFAALVSGSHSVAVLKGADFDFDGVPDFLVKGFSPEDLTACTTYMTSDTGELIPIFVAYVLFTPRR